MRWSADVECVFSPPSGGSSVPVFEGDLFLTTSWWTTEAIRCAVNPWQIIYLLQEDERMFYPRGATTASAAPRRTPLSFIEALKAITDRGGLKVAKTTRRATTLTQRWGVNVRVMRARGI